MHVSALNTVYSGMLLYDVTILSSDMMILSSHGRTVLFCDRDQQRLDTIRKRAFAKVRSGFSKTKDELFLCFIVTNLFCKMSLVITIFLVTQHRLAQEI